MLEWYEGRKWSTDDINLPLKNKNELKIVEIFVCIKWMRNKYTFAIPKKRIHTTHPYVFKYLNKM